MEFVLFVDLDKIFISFLDKFVIDSMIHIFEICQNIHKFCSELFYTSYRLFLIPSISNNSSLKN